MTQNLSPLSGGIEIGGTKTVVLVARGADIIQREQFPTDDPATTLQRCVDRLFDWQSRHGALAAIGIGSFGPLSLRPDAADHGCITNTPKPGWQGTDLLAPIATRFAVPIGIDTDVAGAALAEGRWGASVGARVHAYITVGTGIGAGLVVDGVAVHGLVHPEAGHVRVRRVAGDDFVGSCPFHGDCLEGLASGPAIAARTGYPSHSLPANHPVWANVAAELAELAAILVLMVSAERIVIGGGVANGQPQLLPMLRARTGALLANYVPAASETLSTIIQAPMLGDDSGPLGTIAIAELALARNRKHAAGHELGSQ